MEQSIVEIRDSAAQVQELVKVTEVNRRRSARVLW